MQRTQKVRNDRFYRCVLALRALCTFLAFAASDGNHALLYCIDKPTSHCIKISSETPWALSIVDIFQSTDPLSTTKAYKSEVLKTNQSDISLAGDKDNFMQGS